MLPRPASFVGRERERQLLLDLLRAAEDGSGRLVLVGGEAGVGKTTLIERLLRDAEADDVRTLIGGCHDLETTPPFGPWREALHSCPEDSTLPTRSTVVEAAEPSGLASKEQFFSLIVDYVTDLTSQRPVVIVLEDLHWSDPASLDLLRFLGRDLARWRVLLIASYRDEEITRENPLFRVLPGLIREARAERIDLKPFDEVALQALIEEQYQLSRPEMTRLSTFLQEHSEGNPFFAVELLRALERDGDLLQAAGDWRLDALDEIVPPPLVIQTIERQLEHLEPTTRDAMEVAAVIGPEFQHDLWRAVGGLDDAALDSIVDEALQARVVEPFAAAGLRFRHALIREVLYHGTRVPRRRQLHRMAAEALLDRGSLDPNPIADHFQRAGDLRAIE
jgi:predicted ATPase